MKPQTDVIGLRTTTNDDLYKMVNANPICSRVASLPIALIEEGVYFLGNVLEVIEDIACALLNLVGVIFCMTNKDAPYSIKHTVEYSEYALTELFSLPALVLSAPFRIAYQTVAILYDPINAIRFEG